MVKISKSTAKKIEAVRNEVFKKYYTELHSNCKNCPFYHVQSFEQDKNPMQTVHRCKALSTDHRDEYSRGYYQILEIGQTCPVTNKSITSKQFMEVVSEADAAKQNYIYEQIKNK